MDKESVDYRKRVREERRKEAEPEEPDPCPPQETDGSVDFQAISDWWAEMVKKQGM